MLIIHKKKKTVALKVGEAIQLTYLLEIIHSNGVTQRIAIQVVGLTQHGLIQFQSLSAHKRGRFLCQFCAISLQKQARTRGKLLGVHVGVYLSLTSSKIW